MCLGGKTWFLHWFICSIQHSIEVITNNFSPTTPVTTVNRFVTWNNNNLSCAILNVDGSCHGTPLITRFEGVLQNNSCFFLAVFFCFLPNSDDIMLDAPSAIYHGPVLTKDLGYMELAYYFDCLVCTNLLNGPVERYHVYAVLLQKIK